MKSIGLLGDLLPLNLVLGGTEYHYECHNQATRQVRHTHNPHKQPTEQHRAFLR